MFKAKTVEQFKVYQYIDVNFKVDEINITVVDNTALKVTDHVGCSLIFRWNGKEVVWNVTN